nr:alpha/beta fold hydrolase [Anaerolineae bacterium]
MNNFDWPLLTAVILLLSACNLPGSVPGTTAPVLTEEQTPVVEAPTATPAQEPGIGTPQDVRTVTYVSDGGLTVVGSYYPPAVAPSPGVLLLHQAGTTRSAWEPLPGILRGESLTPSGVQSTLENGYAVLAIDLPGYGESEGQPDSESILDAVRGAISFLRQLDGVDSDSIVLVGAGIGADAAVDTCGDGCVGVIAISPGSFLGIPFGDALIAYGERATPVLCIAAEGDGQAPGTCQAGASAGLLDYEVLIYQGSQHGNILLHEPDILPEPHPYDLILSWLLEHFPPG